MQVHGSGRFSGSVSAGGGAGCHRTGKVWTGIDQCWGDDPRLGLGRVEQGEAESWGSLLEKERANPEVNTAHCLSLRNLYNAKNYRQHPEGQKSVTEVTVLEPEAHMSWTLGHCRR